jgi:hypothetical protein
MKFHVFVAGAAFAALTSIAHAATIERTFDVVASDFTLITGPSTPAPVDPVDLNFTLVFDPLVSVTSASTAGLTINAFNLPNPPYSLAYTYNSTDGGLTVATSPGSILVRTGLHLIALTSLILVARLPARFRLCRRPPQTVFG